MKRKIKKALKSKGIKVKRLPRISIVRKKAQATINKWVRYRKLDPDGKAECVTCGAKDWPQNMDCGHFLHGVNKPTTFEPTNLNCQCKRCNHYLSGNLKNYTIYMIDTYGREEIDRLEHLSHVVYKPTRDFYNQIIEKYQGLLDGIGH